jgi:hypothetical protein
MKDFLGNEIQVGDCIAYRRDYGGMVKGKVVKTSKVSMLNYRGEAVDYDHISVDRPGWRAGSTTRVILRDPRNVIRVPA